MCMMQGGPEGNPVKFLWGSGLPRPAHHQLRLAALSLATFRGVIMFYLSKRQIGQLLLPKI
jgi:hypothetical protein